MKYIFLDTNIFIRFLVDDNKRMSAECKKLFKLIDSGKIKAETDLVVLVEIIWVLSSYFKLERQKIITYIGLLLRLRNLSIRDATIILSALDYYQKFNVDFIDLCGFKRK